ncbi:spexin isoform X1 [Callithrix jacchus]
MLIRNPPSLNGGLLVLVQMGTRVAWETTAPAVNPTSAPKRPCGVWPGAGLSPGLQGAWLRRRLRWERWKLDSPRHPNLEQPAPSPRPGTARCGEELWCKPGLSRAGQSLNPGSRLCRGSALHLRPEPEEGPLRPTTAG